MIRYIIRLLFIIIVVTLISVLWFAKDLIGSNLIPKNFTKTVESNTTGLIKHTLPATPHQVSKNCSLSPKNLNSSVNPASIFKDFANNKSDSHRRLLPGGEYRPPNCTSRSRTAIIVAYRDRKEHLIKFLQYMHRFLQKQELHYMIFIVELTQPTTFNRGLLLNIGFAEAAKKRNFTCYIFHDVDLMPTNENNFYRCNDTIRHLCTANSKFHYKLPYGGYYGGIMAFPPNQFRKVNGYSNLFFGWGGEDDDFGSRVRWAKLTIKRPSNAIGKYEALPHGHDKGNPKNPKRFELIGKGKERWKKDGISNLRYKLVKDEQLPTYTWILVGVNQTELEKVQ